MRDIATRLKDYFVGINYNLFRNVIDALIGSFVLVAFPVASLITVFVLDDITWGSYFYPLIVISISGIYDSIGRFGAKDDVKNQKLWMRISIYLIAIVLAGVLLYFRRLLWLAPTILLLDCLSLLKELLIRISYSIRMRKRRKILRRKK